MNSQVFEKVETMRNHEKVAKQIQEAIIEQRFKPGDKLPSQKMLTKLFQVSNFTVIGALRLLEQSGLVYTKPGAHGGTFVSEIDLRSFNRSLRLLTSMMKVTLEELAEFRLTVEGQAAYWAAQRRRNEDIKKMEDLLDKMRQILESKRSIEDMIPLDTLCHIAIAEGSQNRLCVAIIETVNEYFSERDYSLVPQESMEEIYADFLKIFQAIKAKRSTVAEKAVKEHIVRFEKLIIPRFKQKHPEAESFWEAFSPEVRKNIRKKVPLRE